MKEKGEFRLTFLHQWCINLLMSTNTRSSVSLPQEERELLDRIRIAIGQKTGKIPSPIEIVADALRALAKREKIEVGAKP